MTYNMEGINENLAAVIHLVNRYKPQIMSLQETFLRTSRNVELAEAMREYTWTFKNADSQELVESQLTRRSLSFHGVALGIKYTLSDCATPVEVECPNVLAVKLNVSTAGLLIYNLYLPCAGHDHEEPFEEALDAIAASIKQSAGEAKILLMGDLNITEESTMRRKKAWKTFLQDCRLRDNWTGIPTHHHHVTGVQNELDRFLERDLDLRVDLVNEDIGKSDHKPVRATFYTEIKREIAQPKGEKIETKVNIRTLKEPANLETFLAVTEALADDFDTRRRGLSRDTQNGLLSTLIFQAAITITGQNEFQSQKPRRTKKIKIPAMLIKTLREARRKHGTQHSKSRRTPTGRILTGARKEIRDYVRSVQEERAQKLHMQIIKAANTGDPKLFSILKRVKQVNQVSNKLPTMIEGYDERYVAPNVLPGVRNLFKKQTTIDDNPRFNNERLEVARDVINARAGMVWTEEEYESIKISKEDFDKLIGRLKSGKAQDYLGLSNDLLKNLGPRMKALLARMTQEALDNNDTGGLVRNYGKGTIILKKFGMDPTSIKSWRKIVVNNTVLNVTQLYIQPRMEEKIRKIQSDSQLGFTKGVPVSNAVIARQELQNLSRIMNKTLFFGVLDLQSCFPRICREQALLLAADFLTPAEWDFLQSIYTRTWGEVRVEAQKTKPFPSDIGTIEGGILSVQILKIYVGTLLRMLERAGYDAGVTLTGRGRSCG